MNDPELIERARQGDQAATEDLLRRYAPKVHAVCRRICTNPSDADDAAQEALIAVVRGLPRFDGRSSLSTWVHRVATNACLDEVRRIRRRPLPAGEAAETDIVAGDPGPEERTLGGELRRGLRDALEQLPEEFRVAVVLRDVGDLDYAEIAAILEIPVGTVRSRIARGRGRLADLLHAADPAGNRDGARDVKATSERVTSDPAPGPNPRTAP